ncbi:PREDICTED: GPI ethanolamine phosphate transferase 2 [Ceratosolen solmsi marchali]|uniref:GPI ethanolamine phosphate transferase 2 n=1 Tax=Ceratosolen solmsi marchali TaxID=326594 RepID=A0AAJ6YRV3_9HYME|nr:PREDICTED: GPI ethanolamine phosphate transferase 2 [Ceratosolen solmsi marchali]
MKGFKKRTEESFFRDYFMFNYITVISIFSIILFLYGFFPINYNKYDIATKRNIPKFVDRTRIKLDDVYKPVIKKLIIMVIDAFRWDFISGHNSNETMPITHTLLKNKTGCMYKTKVNIPTVTMPRIKAMMTGSIPNFIDIVLNLGANEITTDNILLQIKNQGHNIVFYGDDTWVKLFPSMFHRYEGTNSFYVNDFTEVDSNVTRNMVMELNKNDWSIMILHYLGLDHIGHISNPFSSLIKPKLQEMDEIIGTIQSYVTKSNKKNEPTLFLVSGDHGMKDSGGHGGSTYEETHVPLLAFGKSCKEPKNQNAEIAQIDIVPTVSVLLGIPMPSTNLGTVILDLMDDFSLSQKLFILHYNAVQLFLHYKKIDDYQYTRANENYENAVKLHAAWLNTNSHPNEMVHDIIMMYESAIIKMKNKLTSSLSKHDVRAMTLATVFLSHILYISMCTERSTSTLYRPFLTVFVTSYIIWMFLNQLFNSEIETILFSQKLDSHFVFVTIPIFGILILNCYLCAIHTLPSFKDSTVLQILLTTGTLVHTLSLSSSSFVEEEHQTWYFYWITIIIFFTYDSLRNYTHKTSLKLLMLLLLLLISHRILRILNSTGDKYAHLPDISGWLRDQDSNIGMTVILIFGLTSLVYLDFIYEDIVYKSITFILDLCIVILIYLRHAVSNVVHKPSFYFNSRGIAEINYLWAFTSIYLLHSIYRLTITVRCNKNKFLSLSLFLILKKWIIISCILHRPYNVILLPMQLMVGITIYYLTKHKKNFDIKIYLYLWSSKVFFFYQGNSNSLATIDVAAGYIGLQSYQPVITGLFLIINTYSAEILGFILYLYDNSLQYCYPSSIMLSLCKKYAFWRLLPMTFYTIIINFHKHHLFIWSVFAPKLLYEAMHCAVLLSLMFLLQLKFVLYDLIKLQ